MINVNYFNQCVTNILKIDWLIDLGIMFEEDICQIHLYLLHAINVYWKDNNQKMIGQESTFMDLVIYITESQDFMTILLPSRTDPKDLIDKKHEAIRIAVLTETYHKYHNSD